MSNRFVLLIIIALLIYIASWAYGFYIVSNNNTGSGTEIMFNDNMGIAAVNFVFFSLCWFGTILGVIIGCSTISSERIGHALSTLAAKPVHRNTIINGKMLGSLAFTASVIVFTMIVYSAMLFTLCGNKLAPYILDYITRLPFVFLFVMVFVTVFLALSILVSLLIRDQAFSMIVSTLMVYVSLDMSDIVSKNVDAIFPGYGIGDLLTQISPYSLMWGKGLQFRFMDTSLGAWDAFLSVFPDFVRLLLFIVVVMALNYVVFVRRDIT